MKMNIVCAVLVGSVMSLRAGESRSPEQLGAHWARVSDEAKVQLLIDGLRSIGRRDSRQVESATFGGGGTEGVVMRKHASAIFRTSLPVSQRGEPEALVTSPKRGGMHRAMSSTGNAEPYTVHVQGQAASVEFASGERLLMEKYDGVWNVTGGSLPTNFASGSENLGSENLGSKNLAGMSPLTGAVSVGESFIRQAVSVEHSIARLTKSVTLSKIRRQMLGAAGKTASYYSVFYRRGLGAPQATYVQFILDEDWNRIVYGNMDKWIKTFSVQAPSAIAVDADGNVFVGEPAKSRVLVLKLMGAALQFDHSINNITNPTDLAINDNGTPFNTSDDVLYVADASENKIFKYTAGSAANTLVATFDGFDSPTGVAVGRWDGVNNRVLYVVDKIAKRVRVFEDEGSSLSLHAEFRGEYSQYFTSIKTDHFGNVYLVDNVSSRVLKLSPSLEMLDEHGGRETFSALGSIDIPFARIEIDGARQWVGFDQLLAIERWDDGSGVQRRALGLKLKNIGFRADADISMVNNTFVLTDVGKVGTRIYDERNRLVRTLSPLWMIAGAKNLLWDRRSDEGTQVPAGTYCYELRAASAYSGESGEVEPVISNTRFYLPMYYAEDCGSANRVNDAHLVRGSVVRWGSSPSQTANEDESSVQYRFTGLNPASSYEVAAEFAAHDALHRLQALTANGKHLLEPQRVTNEPLNTGFLAIPKECYANGEVTIDVNKLGEGSAIVTQLWIKEVGVGFNPQPIATIPTKYSLQQNYPNPFNPSTTIRYAIPDDGLVTLKVYNIAGQEVATLVNEQKKAGKYEIVFDAKSALGSSLASGVYLYRVKAGNFSEAKKMVLLK